MSKRNNKPVKYTPTPPKPRTGPVFNPIIAPPRMTAVQVDNHILRLLQLYTGNQQFRNAVDKILTKY